MTRSGASIVRRTSKTDNYSTPTQAVHALLDRENFAPSILEPAAGEGNIARALLAEGYSVTASDIRELPVMDYPGLDIFSKEAVKVACLTHSDIITNPPFSIALPFAERCLELTGRKIALLLRIQFLEGARRRKFLTTSPLKAVYVFSSRISMYPEGEENLGGGTQCFAWFVWDREWCSLRGDRQEPVVRWIP